MNYEKEYWKERLPKRPGATGKQLREGEKNMKCSAFKCWCGGRELVISETIRDYPDDLLLRVDGGEVYLSTAGYTEHWSVEGDFREQYPDWIDPRAEGVD